MSRRAAAALALLALAGCESPLDFCRACIKTPPADEVADADRARIRFTGPGTLPADARHLHYYEQCGVDCRHWMRFELPEAEARRFAATVLGGGTLRPGRDPFDGSAGGPLSPPVPWWPAHLPADAEGAKIETQEARGGALVLRAEKGLATVWFFEFDM
ncbi:MULTISPECIES: hypothetical protein [unclassified Sphingomonas]|uniref:hypothetical protein n=1 Tax=Sphingomonas TaxID=13687 RepID=UPI00095B130B|nr:MULTISPECIES: hypothetical protein [unclassified Sphingomonas]MBN8811718.1 hypothetical protein [Sphingomonas sp.]OJY52697.1 MAG: hypothetical protein BGP17_14120 [Sphingomonas sp. 67-41]